MPRIFTRIAPVLGLMIPLLIALYLPLLTYENGTVDRGWTFLLLGWFSVLDSNFAWFGNIPLLIALCLLKNKPHSAQIAAIIALAIGLTIFGYDETGAIDSSKVSHIASIGSAAYIWLGTVLGIIVVAELMDKNSATK